ncbi:hypothetical protein G6F68_019113 [Rhizopus microsporus]|nr:hypothetical protein G6F68_019113 [Rhizopus microsporus]
MTYAGQQDVASQYYNSSPHPGYQQAAYSQDPHANYTGVAAGAAVTYPVVQQEEKMYYESKPNEHEVYHQGPDQQLYHDPNQPMYHDPNQQMYHDPNQQMYHDPNQQIIL